ncbi:ABC transporter substrate-binding protein [Mesorhizobium australicum]|uniref:ABC transporter substrate-binding protein n=1 Tax=Mesorhizobium australicum TaxID=536018 RepID=UPI0033374602
MGKYRDSRKRIALFGLVVAVLANSAAHASEKFKVTLNWTPDNGSIGIVYADVLGYYKDAGIDLEIESGKGSGATSKLVAGGSTDAGLASATSAISFAAKGAPIKVIAPIYQLVDWGIVSLEETPIATPKDLEGKTIIMGPGSADIPLFDAMLKANGVDKSKVHVQMMSGDCVAILAEKKADGCSDAPGGTLIPLEQQGIKAKIMLYKDWGAPLVGLSLIAREEKFKQNPQLYKKFIEATLKGYAAVAKSPEAAVDALRTRYPDAAEKKVLLEEMTEYLMTEFCAPGATNLGKPPAAVWKVTGEVLTATFGSLGDGGIGALYTEELLPSQAPACP